MTPTTPSEKSGLRSGVGSKWATWCFLALVLLMPAVVSAQDAAAAPTAAAAPWRLAVDLEGGEGKAGSASVGMQIVVVMTLLSVAPSLILLMTSFTRIVIVLGFVRTAIGVPSAPANQIITGLALFLTLFIMGPVLEKSYKNGENYSYLKASVACAA